MTRDEVRELLAVLVDAYPYISTKIADPEKTIDAWLLAFGDQDAKTIYQAARHHMKTQRFFPAIADIEDAIPKGKMIYGDPRKIFPEIVPTPPKLEMINTNFCKLCGLCDIQDQTVCPMGGI